MDLGIRVICKVRNNVPDQRASAEREGNSLKSYLENGSSQDQNQTLTVLCIPDPAKRMRKVAGVGTDC